MEVNRTAQYKLRPTDPQEMALRRAAGTGRFVWNKGLSHQEARRAAGLPRHSYAELCLELTKWRADPEIPWLAESPATAQQQVLRALTRATKEAFTVKGRGFPKYKKKGKSRDSLRFAQDFKVDAVNGRVMIPKIGWMRLWFGRPLRGTVKQIVVTREADGWYVTLFTERNHRISKRGHRHAASAVGIDMGATEGRFATLSSGEVIPSPQFLLHSSARLAKMQKHLARKQKGSSNYQKLACSIALLHQHIARARLNFLHEVTTKIANTHGIVVMEDLDIRKMTQSARGTVASPSTNVTHKSWLNRTILDQGWGMFRDLLKYKLEEKGGFLFLVDPAYTSQMCSQCEHVDPANRLCQAEFKCTNCSYQASADDNAASNILVRWAAGPAVQNCGGFAIPVLLDPAKQESAIDQEVVLEESNSAYLRSGQLESATF